MCNRCAITHSTIHRTIISFCATSMSVNVISNGIQVNLKYSLFYFDPAGVKLTLFVILRKPLEE